MCIPHHVASTMVTWPRRRLRGLARHQLTLTSQKAQLEIPLDAGHDEMMPITGNRDGRSSAEP